MKKTSTDTKVNINEKDLVEKFRVLSYKVTKYANYGLSRVEFLEKVTKLLINLTSCDEIDLRLIHINKQKSYEIVRCTRINFSLENKATISAGKNNNTDILGFEQLCVNIIDGKFDSSLPFYTAKGSFLYVCGENPLSFNYIINKKIYNYNVEFEKETSSVILIPILNGNDRIGFLKLINPDMKYCTKQLIELFEDFTQTLGISLLNQRTQAALRERVKELTCMYGIAQTARAGASIDKIMQSAVELLPAAWQYPDITCGRIILNGHVYSTPGFKDCPAGLSTDIVVKGGKRGTIEVVYLEQTVELDEGPFLEEERKLLNNIAKALALIIEQKQAEEDKKRLKEQIRHADRLATIGQLSAGVAHELNEPLGNILGFAQLIYKNKNLCKTIKQDIEKIVNASLHAREIVKKLLIFFRQMPTKMTPSDLNQIVEDGLYFLESRCAKEGVTLIRMLDYNLPRLTVDPSQITQVLVNLVVNAIQAMPEGGTLKVETCGKNDSVLIVVEDTGHGMSDDILKQIFLPFFTTKDVGEGTGLGLAVVHGIVTSHGGSIKIDSTFGKGSRFEIKLPLDKPCLEGKK